MYYRESMCVHCMCLLLDTCMDWGGIFVCVFSICIGKFPEIFMCSYDICMCSCVSQTYCMCIVVVPNELSSNGGSESDAHGQSAVSRLVQFSLYIGNLCVWLGEHSMCIVYWYLQLGMRMHWGEIFVCVFSICIGKFL